MAKGAYIGASSFAKRNLPSGYTQVRYIESAGTQYFNTGFAPNNNSRIVLDIQMTSTATQHIFGARATSTSGLFFAAVTSATAIRVDYGSEQKSNTVASVLDRVKIDLNKNTCMVGGASSTYTASTFAPNVPMLLFGSNTDGTIVSDTYKAHMKLYSCKIYDNGVLVRDYVPCTNASNVTGLYDLVNGTFAGSETTAFSAGDAIKVVACKAKKGYIGIEGLAHKIKKAYIGVNGVAKLCWAGVDPVFANNTWADIIAACQANSVPDTWAVGDSKPMTINGVDYQIDIIGKNHDTYSDGSGTAPLTFQMHDLYDEYNTMHRTNTNSVGWAGCSMRTTTLPAFLTLMPSEVQAGIKEVDKMTAEHGTTTTIGTTADKLFFLSPLEIFGETAYSRSGEGSQYEYYSAGGGTRKYAIGSTSNKAWWERSPRAAYSQGWCVVNSTGEGGYTTSSGDTVKQPFMAPAFCF